MPTATDDELDAAAEEGTVETEVVEAVDETLETEAAAEETEVVEEVVKPDLEDQRLKSALGRVGSLQSELDSLKNTVRQLTARLEPEDEDASGIIASEEDVLAVVQKDRQKTADAKKDYVDTAVNALIDVGMEYTDLDDNTYVKVHKDAENNWKSVTGDPKQDAKINFTDAMNRHYKAELAKSKEPINPLDKNKDNDEVVLGGATETKVVEKTVKTPKLDAAAEDFVKRTGMQPESVIKALTGDMPAYLGGR